MKAPTSPVFYPLSLHDALPIFKLATLYRAGELTPIYVPTEDNEALRDLVRAREDIKEDELRAKHRLTKILLRNEINRSEEHTSELQSRGQLVCRLRPAKKNRQV